MGTLNFRTDFGASGNGIDDDSVAWRAAMAVLSAAGGGSLFVPAGRYLLPRYGSASWCADLTANYVNIWGEGPSTVFVAPMGMPATPVALMRIDKRVGVSLSKFVLDGNWGAVIGETNDNAGHNHATQGDPKNPTLMIRGCVGVTVRDVHFRQAYGDHVWIGHGADTVPPAPAPIRSYDILLERCTGELSARNGLTLGGSAARVRVRDCDFISNYTTALDFEPQTTLVEDFQATGCLFDTWWDPTRGTQLTVTIDGVLDEALLARNVRLHDCRINGTVLVQRAKDVQITGCRIATEWGGQNWAPVHIRFNGDDILVENCQIYDTCVPTGNYTHTGAVHVQYYASGPSNYQPRDCVIRGNNIFPQRGVHGVHVNGTAGGMVVVEDNCIDSTNLGMGAGGSGVDVWCERPGSRVLTRNNRIRNAMGAAVRFRFTSAANQAKYLGSFNDCAWDDQSTPTCTAVVQADSPTYTDKLDIVDWINAGGIV